jgi:hypothetical protein
MIDRSHHREGARDEIGLRRGGRGTPHDVIYCDPVGWVSCVCGALTSNCLPAMGAVKSKSFVATTGPCY